MNLYILKTKKKKNLFYQHCTQVVLANSKGFVNVLVQQSRKIFTVYQISYQNLMFAFSFFVINSNAFCFADFQSDEFFFCSILAEVESCIIAVPILFLAGPKLQELLLLKDEYSLLVISP